MTPNDPSRIREEKARLYQSAVEAWGKGEVASAMSKLEELAAMDRDFPDPDAGRGNTYRNFYNQVNSESEALKTAYEEARGNLATGNADAAMAICRQYLAKYPNHALFQTLKSDIETSLRPKSPELVQEIAETDKRMQQDGDLNRRVAIAESALVRFPDEPHFVQAVKDAREMRDLVSSIVTQARFFEEQGQLGDALDQWQILRSIHSKQPGIDGEIQRLMQKRTEASKPAPAPVAPPPPPPVVAQAPPPPAAPRPSQTKGPWVEQAQKYLELGDYQRAMQAVSIGLAESPNDPELLALDAQVRKGQDSAGRALELLGKAHDEMNKGATEAARGSLREAFRLDPRNAVIRTVLVNSLLEEARGKMDADPGKAQSLVQEVLRMEPGHTQATILAQGMADRKAAPPPPPPPPPIPVAAPPVFPPPPPTPPKAAAPPMPPPSMREAPTVAVPASVTQALFNKDVPPAAPPPPATPVPPPPKPPAAARAKGGTPKKLLLGTGAAVLLLVLVALGVTFMKKKPAPPPVAAPSTYAVVLKSTPEGAEIKINGVACGVSTCTKDLTPGTYQLEAELSGYSPAAMTASIGQGAAKEYNLLLNPLGPRVALVTNLADGTITLDENPPVPLQGGAAEVANLSQAKHTLTVKGADSNATIPIEILPGAAPVLTGAIDAKNARAFVVAGFGGDAKVYGSGTGFRASLDGKPVGALAPAGLPLQGLTPGTHELVIVSDAGQQDRMVFESQPAATLYVMLGTAQNLGTLSVETNEDQAHLIINGQKYKRDTARGHLVVYLFPRKYTVTVQKDGFAPAVEQTVEVKRGQDTKVSFTLSAAKSILAVHHAPPGSDVAVDNISRGTVHPDGEFQVGGIEPGRHTVTLRHDGFRPMQGDQNFVAGKTTELLATMEAAPTTGTLRFEINPAGLDAHVRIKRDGDAQEREVSGTSVSVPEGHYVVNISAPQYATTSASVQVTAGNTAVAAVTLRRLEAKAPAKTNSSLTFGLEDWLKTPGWSTQNGMITHKGGDWVMAPPDISQGTIRFTVVSLKGRHVEWAVASRDEKNFVHYELDDKNLTRYEVRNGNKLTQIKKPHGLDKKKPMGISLAVTPGSIVISVQNGGWVDLDKWDSGVQAVHGRFGFRIPGSDEIGLQDFSIQP